MNHAGEDVKPFSRQGLCQTVYDIIEELPFYRAATTPHMQWIRSIATRQLPREGDDPALGGGYQDRGW